MTEPRRPVEIRPEDIIRRPDNLPESSPGSSESQKSGNILSQFTTGMKQLKEVIDVARELGILDQLRSMGFKIPGGKESEDQGDNQSARQPQGGSAGAEYVMLLRILKTQYGNCTLNELIDNLRRDYGDKKLSDFGG